MSETSSTLNYLSAVKKLAPLTSDKLFASGLEITIGHIGKDGPFVSIQLDGESVDALKTVINCSVARILATRKLLLQSELASISDFFE